MNTPFARSAVRLLIVFFFASGLIGPSQWTNAQAQDPPPDEQPILQAADSHKMLPPVQPRVKSTVPAPFHGIKQVDPPAAPALDLQKLPAPDPKLLTPQAGQSNPKKDAVQPKGAEAPQQPETLPNLAPYTPSGWSSPVVLSNVTGTTTYSTLTQNQPVYIDWSVGNDYADIYTDFTTCLLIDGTPFYCSGGVYLPANYYWPNFDLYMNAYFNPTSGWHTIEIVTDYFNDIQESNETDNSWWDYFYWNSDGTGTQINLAPYTPYGWAAPVVLSDQLDATSNGALVTGQPFYLNMATLNEGPDDIPNGTPFTAEVWVNSALVYSIDWSWGLPINYYLYEVNYQVNAAIPAGWNSVCLYTDANYDITETNEDDNWWCGNFYWNSPTLANLRPYTPTGWSNSVMVTSTTGITGDIRLYADRNAYFHFSVLNDGNTAANNYHVKIMIDGNTTPLCDYIFSDGPYHYTSVNDFSLSAGSLSPGWHTVRMVIDPTNVIQEFNENDNSWEADFYWEASSLPNLHPYQPTGWDDAVVVSSGTGTNTFDVLTAGQTSYLDWAVVNDGWGDILNGDAFRTTISLDGSLMHSWDYSSGLPIGWYLYLTDYPLTLTEGWHSIELATDTQNGVDEVNENDNYTAVWVYVEKAQGQPKIRVEPGAITVDIAAASAPSSLQPVTLARDMTQLKPFDAASFGLGAEITPPTQYIQPKIPLQPVANLPAAVDHSSGLPPVGNQGNAGSCVGWATSYYYKSYQEGIDQGWNLTLNSSKFSPNYVWNQIQPSSSCGGTYPGQALQLITEKGDITLSSMPYSEDCKTQPTQPQLDFASNYRAENYGSFFTYGTHPSDAVITQMKEWIVGGDIMQLSIPVPPEFDNPSGPYCIVDLPSQGASRGGHAITIVGYDDNIGGQGKQGFKIVNSWGTGYGCGGFAYITYDWIKNYAMESWWMRDKRTGSSTFRDFTIHNDGNGVLTVSQINQQNASGWLKVVLPEALPMQIEPGASKTVQIALNTAGLTPGTYNEVLLVNSDDPTTPQSQVSVTLHYGVSVSTTPPGPNSPHPADGAGSTPTILAMSWNTTQAAAGVLYDLRLDTTNPPASVICNDISNKLCGIATLHPNTTYYWRVVTQNAMYSTLGPVWSFTTGATTVLDKKVFLPSLRK